MDTLDKAGLGPLFQRLRTVFADQREALIALDGQVGDSDLGITMNKAFDAAAASIDADLAGADERRATGSNAAESNAADSDATGGDPNLGKTLARAGMAMARAAPSTMGTLMATGFMRGGRALDGNGTTAIDTAAMAAFWRAFADGIAERGKARPGDKTVVDVLGPIASTLATAAGEGRSLPDALDEAVTAAQNGLEATKTMVAQHGKAAAFQDRTRGLQDAGATVGVLIIEAFRDEVRGAGSS